LGFAVTYRVDEDFHDTADQKPRSRVLVHIVVAVMLAGAGSGSALLWRGYGNGLPSFTSAASSAAPVADRPVGLADFQAFQQQIAGSVQATEKLLTAQQAEIKRLSDQLAVLSGKLDLLQQPIASAQAALPPPAPKPVAPPPRKKPTTAAQPAGAISTGGAPLPPPMPLTR
jgi:uncharacterized coiled-coil protein SlyX